VGEPVSGELRVLAVAEREFEISASFLHVFWPQRGSGRGCAAAPRATSTRTAGLCRREATTRSARNAQPGHTREWR
jgi:hypothetical protein